MATATNTQSNVTESQSNDVKDIFQKPNNQKTLFFLQYCGQLEDSELDDAENINELLSHLTSNNNTSMFVDKHNIVSMFETLFGTSTDPTLIDGQNQVGTVVFQPSCIEKPNQLIPFIYYMMKQQIRNLCLFDIEEFYKVKIWNQRALLTQSIKSFLAAHKIDSWIITAFHHNEINKTMFESCQYNIN